MIREMIAKNRTMCHSWSLVYLRVPLQRPHLLRHHLHHRIQYSTLADIPKIQYLKEVEVRVRTIGKTRCINQQKPKTKIKMVNQKKYKVICYMNCWIGCRSSENLVDERSPSEPRGNPAPGYRDTSSSSHELPMESRAKVEPGSGKHSVCTHFPKDLNCDICLRCFLQKTCWYSRAQSENFVNRMSQHSQ